ncbi:MAG: O-antigen ligase family protein [Sphingobacteriales bacterium]|jgi:O-antigen ligase
MMKKLSYLLFLLLVCSIPLSMEFQLTSYLGTDLPDEQLMWFLSPLVILLAIHQRKKIFPIFNSPITVLLILSLFWVVITILFSVVPLLSIKYLLAKLWYIIPFTIGVLFFMNDEQSLIRAAKYIVLSLLFTVLVILFRHALLGFSFDGIKYIMWPFYRNHVNYGALLVCLIPVAIGLYFNNRNWAIVVIILLVGLFFTYSRGAWLALAVGGIMVWLIKRRMVQWALLSATIIVLSISVWLLKDNHYLRFRPNYEQTIYHYHLDDHLSATYTFRDLSTVERFYRWIAATKMIKERWIFGYGPNSFYPYYKQYTVNSFRTYVSGNPERSTVHNYFLLLFAEQGLPGLLLFTTLLFYMMWSAQELYHQLENKFYKGVALIIGSILSMISVLIMLSDLIETDKIGSIFYLSAGLLIVLQSKLTALHPVHRVVHSQEY